MSVQPDFGNAPRSAENVAVRASLSDTHRRVRAALAGIDAAFTVVRDRERALRDLSL